MQTVTSILSLVSQVQGTIEHFLDDCNDALTWLDTETYYTAFTEGWALYSENPLIAEDTDTYDNEPMQKFGMLKWQVRCSCMYRIYEGLPGGPCSLVPFQNCPMFPCSHTFSECFRTLIFRILFPCSQKLANVPLFPSIFWQCSPVPQNPWETLIYSIKRPGRLLNFWTLRVGTYSRWAFIRGWALIKFSPFSASNKFILQQNNK